MALFFSRSPQPRRVIDFLPSLGYTTCTTHVSESRNLEEGQWILRGSVLSTWASSTT